MEPDKKLTELAGAIALEAPLERTQYTTDAKVPWTLIEKIRTRLTELGMDWKEVARDVQARTPHRGG